MSKITKNENQFRLRYKDVSLQTSGKQAELLAVSVALGIVLLASAKFIEVYKS